MKKIVVLTFALVFFRIGLYSQSIKNTEFKQQGNDIIVTYSLSIPDERIVNIELYVSLDGGKNYTGPLKAVSGDVGEISTSGAKSITWNVFEEFKVLEGNVSFEVRARLQKVEAYKGKYLAYNASGSSAFGLTFGTVYKTGWYARIKTNGVIAFTNYKTDNIHITNYTGSGLYIFTDIVKRSRIGLTFGINQYLQKDTYLYVGGGFGYRGLLWNAVQYSTDNNQQISEIWAQQIDKSALGVELELGLMFKINKMNLSFGLNTINFKFFEVNGGLGFFF